MVKDLRTGEQTSQIAGVMDGDLDAFIEAYLAWLAAGKPPRAKTATDDFKGCVRGWMRAEHTIQGTLQFEAHDDWMTEQCRESRQLLHHPGKIRTLSRIFDCRHLHVVLGCERN